MNSCSFYTPGHHTHYIQVRLAWTNDTFAPAQLIDVNGHQLTFTSEGELIERWHHDADALTELAERLGNEPGTDFIYSAKYHVAMLTTRAGTNTPYCLAEEPSRCSSEYSAEEIPADPFERMMFFGGGFLDPKQI